MVLEVFGQTPSEVRTNDCATNKLASLPHFPETAIAGWFAENNSTYDKEQILQLLETHRDRLDEFAVKALFLFGLVARSESTSESNVDFLVEFRHPVGLFTMLGFQSCLEELLGCSVDVGISNSLRSHLRKAVLKEAFCIF